MSRRAGDMFFRAYIVFLLLLCGSTALIAFFVAMNVHP